MVLALQTAGTGQIRPELAGRERRIVNPRVIAVEEIDDSGDAIAAAPAQAGEIVDAIASALTDRDSARLRSLGSRLLANFHAQRLPTGAELPRLRRELLARPCLFDVRYGAETLAENAGLLPRNAIGTIALGYTGGAIDDAAFSIAEYRIPGSEAGYRYLVAKRAPALTELERLVLECVPSDAAEFHVGPRLSQDCFQKVADVARQMVEDARNTKRTTYPTPMLPIGVPINFTAPAQALVQARRDLLERSWATAGAKDPYR